MDNPRTYLITGYPRSRTAWLSNFLTYGPSFCFHELGSHKSVEKFPKFFRQIDKEVVGVSEAMAVIYFDRFMDLFPESRIVVVRRNKEDVIKSLKRYDFDFVTDLYDAKLEEIAKYGIEVPFENLPIEKIWHHCVPGVSLHVTRARMLERCRIELTDVQVELHRMPKPFI